MERRKGWQCGDDKKDRTNMMRILLHGLLVLCSVAVVLTISEGGLRLLVEGQVGAGDATGDNESDRGEKWIRRE